MNYLRIILVALFMVTQMSAQQNNLPYYEIPEASQEFTAGAVLSRMIDGLGFRYYWATEGLSTHDLNFKFNEGSRSTRETITHILELSEVILKTANKQFTKKYNLSKITDNEKRKITLYNFKAASEIFKQSESLAPYRMTVKKGDKVVEYSIWNLMNGPIEDAVWHTGQIASFRRMSGNPFPKGVSLLTGKVKK